MVQKGKFGTITELYNMPVHLRLYYYNRLVEDIQKENERDTSPEKPPMARGPNISR